MKRIAVTGGGGQIAYSILFRIASGEMLGKDQPIALHILEIPEALEALKGADATLPQDAESLIEAARARPAAKARFCLECGMPIEGSSRFCLECGTPAAVSH